MQITITCEEGAPVELLRDALLVGDALASRDHAVSYVVADVLALVDYAGGREPGPMYQAPMLRQQLRLSHKPPPVDGFEDLMAIMGYADRRHLQTLASLWSRQLSQLKPDVILGFCSPVVWLVGPNHAPTFAAGNSFAIPPTLGRSFPRFSARSAPIAAEQTMVANANAVQAKHGGASLIGLSDVIEQCNVVHYGLPYLDPYLPLRKSPSLGFLGDAPEGPLLPPTQPRIVALLDAQCPNIEVLILALPALHDVQVEVYLQGGTAGMHNFLRQQSNIKVWESYDRLLEKIKEASLVVHHGLHEIVQHCLSVGRPHLMVPWKLEQNMVDGSIKWMGTHWSKSADASLAEIVSALEQILKDKSPIIQAQHHARQLANNGHVQALPTIIDRIEGAKRQ